MLDEVAVQLALRAKAITLTVTTTGSISLAATTTGYTRTASTGTVTSTSGFATFSDSQAGKLAAGSVIVVDGLRYTLLTFNGGTLATLSGDPTFGASAFTMGFLVENFAIGMEIAPAGFTSNTARVITGVTATTITVNATLAAQAAGSGRSLAVGLPSNRSWENIEFQPTAGVPWVWEELLPGPTSQVTIGPTGELENTPMYVLHFNVPAASGLSAKRYTHAARVLFTSRTEIPIANGGTIRVRADVGPFTSQLLQSQAGFAAQSLTIPLRYRSPNSI